MNDREMTALLERAGSGLRPEVGELVAGGAARGRTRLRRRRAGLAMVAAAVVALAGAGVVVSQLEGPDTGATTVLDPAGSPTGKAQPGPDVDAPTPAVGDPLALDPEGIRAQLATMLPGDVGPILTDPPYPVVSNQHERTVHFRYRGTLASFIIEPARTMATCAEQSESGSCEVVGGTEMLRWGPTTADQVTAQGVSVWRRGYIVSALSYNAAEGKDVAPLTVAPPISLATLTEIAMSDAWYS